LNPDRTKDFIVIMQLEVRRSAQPVKVRGCPELD
jgi:hypothetical protein